MSKYNVGDVVKLRDDLEIDRQYGGITFTNYKNEFKNESIKIIQVSEGDNTYRVIDEDNNAIWISEEMIEGLWEEKQDKLKLIDVLNMIARGELKEGTKVKWQKMKYIFEDGELEREGNEETVNIFEDMYCINLNDEEVELIEPPCEHEWGNYETHRIGEGLINKGRRCKKCGLEEVTEERNVEADKTIEPTKIEELIDWYATTNDDKSNEMLLHIVWDKLNEVIRKINKE